MSRLSRTNTRLQKWLSNGKGKKPEPPKEPAICKSKLTNDDWITLTYVHEMLQPFKEATKLLEGRPDKGEFGAIWDVLPVMDALLETLEELKIRYKNHPEKHFCENLNQAWLKLDKYHRLTDESPAYLAAMVLHPLLRWRAIEEDLWAQKPQWVKEGKAK